MKKGITRDQIRQTLEWTLSQGFNILLQLIFGFPGEDEESLAETRNLLQELQLPASFAVMTPLPGSSVYEEVRAQGLIPDEDVYFDNLREGYINRRKVLLNLTNWSDEEFHTRKRELETAINQAASDGPYVKSNNPRYPSLFIKRYGFRPWVEEFIRKGATKLQRLIASTGVPPKKWTRR
jgi:radical SAM superfamily enzyme YgiQ (UPF0313 family)